MANLQAQAALRQDEAHRNQHALNDSRGNLDRLIDEKRTQEETLAGRAEDLQKVMDQIGREAGGLKSLMDRIASLRAAGKDNSPRIKTVGPGRTAHRTLVPCLPAPALAW